MSLAKKGTLQTVETYKNQANLDLNHWIWITTFNMSNEGKRVPQT